MQAETRFERCLAEVLRQEGGYVDHPADPGGATNMGITRKTLARWRRISPWSSLPKSEVAALTSAEAAKIYRALYWGPCGGERLPAGLDLAVFDYGVNSGPDRAVRTLQAVLGVAADGIVGPVTQDAARRADLTKAIGAICDRRMAFLRGLSTFATFGTGWSRRVSTIRAASLAIASASSSTTFGSKMMDKLNGYRTYIVAALMLLAGLAQMLGIDLPTLDGSSAGNLILEALAVIFLRKGLKGGTGNA